MPLQIFAQGISNLWMTGYVSGPITGDYGGSNIDFFTGYPDTSRVLRSMNFSDCNANISDSSGHLLFYSNGIYVANANNDTMLNGNNLNPSTYTNQSATLGLRIWQGNLILPLPGSNSIYYLFHETLYSLVTFNGYRPLEIYYSVIDMNQSGGLGAVTQKNISLLTDTLTIGSITACKHANGRDWWLVFHKATGQTFYEFLLTPSGLQGPFVQNIGYSVPRDEFFWQSCFSPNGKKYACVLSKDSSMILDFDRCTGAFNNSRMLFINDSAISRGVAFSSSSQFLYISSMKYVYQFNTNTSNIDSSRITIATYDGFADGTPTLRTLFYQTALANDNKIYIISPNGTKWLHVINNPNNPGFACHLVQHSFLLPTYNAFTIPNFPNYFLGPDSGSVCDSLPHRIRNKDDGNTITINSDVSNHVISISGIDNNNFLFRIVNVSGNDVGDKNNLIKTGDALHYDFSSLTPGIYLVEVECKEKHAIKKIIKE